MDEARGVNALDARDARGHMTGSEAQRSRFQVCPVRCGTCSPAVAELGIFDVKALPR